MTRMISAATGNVLPCCWTDCTRPGDSMYEAIRREPGRKIHFVFCSERHRRYWVNSVRDMGNLPSGSKSLGGPVQGWGGNPKG